MNSANSINEAGQTIRRRTCRPPHLLAAGIGCLLLAGAFLGALAWLTHGGQVWTLDGRRALMVASNKLVARPVILRDTQGQTFSPWHPGASVRHVYLVDFIYTRCPTICSVLGSEFFQLQQRIQQKGLTKDVSLLSISIDPERDTTAELAAYAHRQHADSSVWQVSAARIAPDSAHLLRQLDVIAVPDGLGGYIHNGEIHLIDAQGRVRGLYDYAAFSAALEAAKRISRGPAAQ